MTLGGGGPSEEKHRPVYQRSLVRGRRVSAIAAITTDGVLPYENLMTRDSVNGDKFLDYVRGSYICVRARACTFDCTECIWSGAREGRILRVKNP